MQQIKNKRMYQEKKRSGVIFQNKTLEKLTRTSPAVTVFFYSIVISVFLLLNFRLTDNGIGITAAWHLGGILAWSFLEYVLHRYLFHIDEYFPGMKRFHYIVHGVHHENPRDRDRLFMPPVPGTIIAFLLFCFWYLFFGSNAYAFMAGISNGYLLYSYIHYSVHTKPVYYPLRTLWKHHALHHFKYHDKAFGVSSPLWDLVFGTLPPRSKKR
jgi:sterol desaturase/sphingolipid hydroxylase (fatty acid hydroxylase superfamily)